MPSHRDRPETSPRRHPESRSGDLPSRPVIQFPVTPSQPQSRSQQPSPHTKHLPPSESKPLATPSRSNRRRRSRRSRNDRGSEPMQAVAPLSNPQRPARGAHPPQPIRPSTASAPTSPAPARRRTTRRPSRPPKLLVYFTRLVVLGVGVAGIAGTALSVWNPALRPQNKAAIPIQQGLVNQPLPGGRQQVTQGGALPLGKELTNLKAAITTLATQTPGLTLSAFLYNPETREYLNIQADAPISAASMIKVPILVAFLQDVDAGKVQLNEPLTLKETQIASGSGDIQAQPPGTVYTALETASWMIINSDNTATNMMIDRLGGAEKLNERFRSWGLEDTVIRNPLPDLEGTNTTSPEDLVTLMTLIDGGELLSLRSRDRLFAIMQRTYTDTLLPQGLGEGAIISHKTGDIGSLVGDVGLIDLPNGSRYIITVMVKRPHNDGRAQELIRLISRSVYEELSLPLAPAKRAGAASDTAAPSSGTPSNSESDSSGE